MPHISPKPACSGVLTGIRGRAVRHYTLPNSHSPRHCDCCTSRPRLRPAGSLPALKAGRPWRRRRSPGLQETAPTPAIFSGLEFRRQDHGRRDSATPAARFVPVLVAINTFPQPGRIADWRSAVDAAADLVDAIILADVGLLDYACRRHPGTFASLGPGFGHQLQAINFAQREFRCPPRRPASVLTLARSNTSSATPRWKSRYSRIRQPCVMNEGRCWSRPTPAESPTPSGLALRPSTSKNGKRAQTVWTPASTAFSSIALPTMNRLVTPLCARGRFESGHLLRPGRTGPALNVCLSKSSPSGHQGRGSPTQPGLCRTKSPEPCAQPSTASRPTARYQVRPDWQAQLAKVPRATGHPRRLTAPGVKPPTSFRRPRP